MTTATRYCNKCGQARIVCRHGQCELCDDYECFAIVPGISMTNEAVFKRRNQGGGDNESSDQT